MFMRNVLSLVLSFVIFLKVWLGVFVFNTTLTNMVWLQCILLDEEIGNPRK